MPTRPIYLTAGLVSALTLAGCATDSKVDRLIYAKNLTVGISVSTSGGTNPDVSVGVRSQNLAIVPAYDEAKGEAILGSVGSPAPQDKDALSVLGQFSSETKANGVTLGEFFSTGVAAQKLADGLACEVSNGTAPNCK